MTCGVARSRFVRPGHTLEIISLASFPAEVPSVQPVLDSQAWHSFEIGSVG
jgi:hypothetical protein